MLKNYLKIAFRNIIHGKLYSFINITGLIIGLTSFILIIEYVQNQYSYDSFNKKADRIYRLNKINTPKLGSEEKHAVSSGMMGPTIAKDFPEVEQSVRVLPWFSEMLFKNDNQETKISDVVFADSNFFDVFDYKLLEGDPKTALLNPMSMVISSDIARLFFGDEDPLGKIIYYSNNSPFKITGVIENSPHNSHLNYNILISWSTTVQGATNWRVRWANNWLTQADYTYLLLKHNTDYKKLEKKLPAIIQQHLPMKTDQYHLYLQPLKDIYLGSSDIQFTNGTRIGNGTYVRILFFTAILILLLASFNFMNLTSARAFNKAREVGVRKALGAQKLQIAKQFLVESILITFIATILSVLLIEIILPVYSRFSGITLNVNYFELLLLITALTFTVGIISGIYPAILLSGFKPAIALRGISITKKRKNIPRKVSVGLQFIISAFLITSTIVIIYQMQFVMNTNLGFNPEQVIVLNTSGTRIPANITAFNNELLNNSDIKSVCLSSSVPGNSMMGFKIIPEGKSTNEDYISEVIRVGDFNFAKTYGLQLLKGRYLSNDFSLDKSNGIVINETLANELGWKNPIGKKLNVRGEVDDGVVIGVVKDFHMNSLHHKVGPVILYYNNQARIISVKINAANISSTLGYIARVWKKFDNKSQFDYDFINKSFAELYNSDIELMKIFSLFAGLAIFIACLGLFGLITYSSERRKKEIGIRKVLGAKTQGIVLLLSKEFLLIITVATLISWPVTYYIMNNWLQDFAYRINLDIGMFLSSGIILILLAFVTMWFQAIKTANTNPVKSLRYE